MGLKFKCPSCGAHTTAYECSLGATVTCDKCRQDVTIPTDPALAEHVPDPDYLVEQEEAGLVESVNVEKRSTWAKIVLSELAILNPLFGIMILITNYSLKPLLTSRLDAAVGVLLIVSLVFVVGLIKRLRWGVWGYLAIQFALIAIAVFDMHWILLLQVAVHLFLFYLLVRSEWDWTSPGLVDTERS